MPGPAVVQIPSLDDSRIQWKDAISKNGRPFRIGVLKDDDAVEAQGEVAKGPSGIKPASNSTLLYSVNIDWPVDNTLHYTSDDFKATTGIRAYENQDFFAATIFKYRFEFKNTENYNFFFYDKTGDSYKCNTWVNGTHLINYNSDNPTMVRVEAY